jgi:hypothetical protein
LTYWFTRNLFDCTGNDLNDYFAVQEKSCTFVKKLINYISGGTSNMAIPIRAIPVLEGEVADRFYREMHKAEKERGTIRLAVTREAARKSWEKGIKMGYIK